MGEVEEQPKNNPGNLDYSLLRDETTAPVNQKKNQQL
jgi:hypothetical protein